MSKRSINLRAGMASKLSVDRAAGVIRGVSIITAGESKGYDFVIDGTTVNQVHALINASAAGIPSRLTHAENEGVDPIRVMAGKFKNAVIDNGRVLADFHIGSYAAHSPEGNLSEYLLGLAEDAPEAVGTSIVAFEADIEDGALRVLSLDYIDWVGHPAANPAGMLSAAKQTDSSGGASPSATSAPVTKGNVTMNPKQIAFLQSIGLAAGANEQQVADFVAALDNDKKAALEAAANETSAAPATVAASAKPTAPAVSLAAKGESVSLANLSELNDLAVLSDLGGDWAMKMAIEGVSLSEARKIALAEKAKKRAPVPMSGSGTVQVGEDLNLSTLAPAISDAICLRAGIAVNAIPELDENRRAVMLSSDDGKRTMQTRKAHARASQFRHLSLCEMVRHQLIALGVKHSDALAMDNSRLAAIALSPNTFHRTLQKFGVALTASTSDFSSLLADSMGKTLRNAYSLATATWPAWCGRKTAKDFKTIRSVQLSEAPTLVSMPEGDEYEFGYLQDAGETTTLGSYGKGLKITRQAIINDDTDAFSRAASSMGRAALRLEESTAYAILTANAVLSDSVALFATAHANLTTGTLTVDNIGAAIAKMLAQVPLGGSTGQTVDVNAFTLVVPTSKWVLANKVINSPVDPALYNNTPNPLNAYPIQVVHSPILEASSAIIWYLFANPAQAECVNLWLLEGQEGPRINEEVEFTTDAMMMTVGHDVTAKAVEYRHGVRSSGS